MILKSGKENRVSPVESTLSKSSSAKLHEKRIRIRAPVQMCAVTTNQTPQHILFNPGKHKSNASVITAAYPDS